MRTYLTSRRGRILLVLGLGLGAVGVLALRAQVATNRPDLDLVYPGSTVITRQDADSGSRLMVASSATVNEILAFYRAELSRRGFAYGGGAALAPTTIEQFACAWHDADHIFRLAFMDLEDLDPAYVAQHMTGQTTMYRWSVIDATASEIDRPCSILLEGDPAP